MTSSVVLHVQVNLNIICYFVMICHKNNNWLGRFSLLEITLHNVFIVGIVSPEGEPEREKDRERWYVCSNVVALPPAVGGRAGHAARGAGAGGRAGAAHARRAAGHAVAPPALRRRAVSVPPRGRRHARDRHEHSRTIRSTKTINYYKFMSKHVCVFMMCSV